MAGNRWDGWKMLENAENSWKWLKMAENDWLELHNMDGNCWKCIEMASMAIYGWK